MKYAIPPRVEARGISNSNGSGGANRCRQNHAPKAPAAVYYGRLQIRHAVSAASGHTHPTQLYIAPTGTVIGVLYMLQYLVYIQLNYPCSEYTQMRTEKIWVRQKAAVI